MYTQNGNPVPGLGSVPLPSGPVAGGRFEGAGLGQDETEPEPVEQEQYVRVTQEPAEIVPVASAAEAQQLIALLQTRLQQRNFDPGTVDGLWGPKTAGALDAGRVANEVPKGTARVSVIQQVVGVDRPTATRINDAINYQLAARAEKTPVASPAPQPMVTMPDGSMAPAAALSRPVYKKWWFWALLLVGVGTAGAVTYYIIKKQGEDDEYYSDEEVTSSFVEAEDEEF